MKFLRLVFRHKFAKKHQFFEILSFETHVSSQEVMLGAPKLGGTLLGSMQRFLTLFPWRSTFLKNNPQCPQNANKWRIFGHIGGNMSRKGTARDGDAGRAAARDDAAHGDADADGRAARHVRQAAHVRIRCLASCFNQKIRYLRNSWIQFNDNNIIVFCPLCARAEK